VVKIKSPQPNNNNRSKSISHNSILADDSTIHNFISKLHLPIYFSKPVIQHITHFIAGAIQKGYRGRRAKTNRIIYPQGIRTSKLNSTTLH